MSKWEEKGCPVCRRLWETGQFPPKIDVNIAEHASLHRCPSCGTLWEQHERFADTISEQAAQRRYSSIADSACGDKIVTEDSFVPLNALEFALVKAMDRHTDISEFLRMLLTSRIAIPSVTEVQENGLGMSPVVYDKGGQTMVAVFTDPERAKRVRDLASFCVVMNGNEFLNGIPPEFGIVVNPGFSAGLDISPSGIQEIRRTFLS